MTPKSIQEAAERAAKRISVWSSAPSPCNGPARNHCIAWENAFAIIMSELAAHQPAAVADGAKERVWEYGTTTVAAVMEAHRKFGESVRRLYKPTPPAEPTYGSPPANIAKANDTVAAVMAESAKMAAEPSAEGDGVAAIRAWITGKHLCDIYVGAHPDDAQRYLREDAAKTLAALEKAERERDDTTEEANASYLALTEATAHSTALEAELKEAREKLGAEQKYVAEIKRLNELEREETKKAEARATALQERYEAAIEHAEKRMNHECGEAALRVNQAMELLESEHAAHKDTQEALAVSKSLCRNSVEEIGADLAASRKQVAELTAAILRYEPREGAWENACPFCGAQTKAGEIPHEPNCVIALAKSFPAPAHESSLRARITALEAALNEARGVAGGALINFSPDLNPNGCWLLRDSIAIMDAALAPASAPTETEKEQ